MKNYRRVFILEWPEGMGSEWLSTDKLSSLLFTPAFSRRTVIETLDVTHSVEAITRIASALYKSTLTATKIAAIVDEIQDSDDPISLQELANLFGSGTEIGKKIGKRIHQDRLVSLDVGIDPMKKE
jgi:hypothetical protein